MGSGADLFNRRRRVDLIEGMMGDLLGVRGGFSLGKEGRIHYWYK